ncbi:MAG: choice-of-anchor B family protein [Bacteroidia bacterium]|nr:choice-of-anchor B family protein [Bacteroidia bacterium]
MKKLLAVISVLLVTLSVQAQLNVSFRSNLPYPNDALSNIGGYVDSLGNEYALVGYESGLSIVNVTDPANPTIAFNVPGTTSIWREVKTWQNYAYVTTEGCCNGLQIVNLGYLPDSVQVKYWTGDNDIAGQLETIHALHVDAGYVYLFGSNQYNGSALVVDLTDPWNPTYKGHTPGTYIHDGFVRNDTLWAAHIYDGYFAVYDLSNKTNPVVLASQITPTQFTHNTWLNDAGTVLFTTDENSGSYLGAYDITDLGNIRELDRLQLTPGSGSIIHNTHTLNDYEVISWYKDGIAIVDVSRPDNMIVTGHYDTYTQGSGNGFNGAWGVYPFLPSGNLVVSDIDNGLYVLTPTYIRGCYLEGNVTDSVTGIPLNNVVVTIISTSTTKNTNITGDYKTGLAAAGTYDVSFSKAGYITKTITGVQLQNGIVTNLNVQLATTQPLITVSGTVTDANTGAPIANATVFYGNGLNDNTVVTNSSGQFTIPGFFPGTYDITVGLWGYNTYCSNNQNITGSSGPLNISLIPGYYDDFSLDFGWTVSGPSSNVWERAVPVATYNSTAVANPGTDAANDCYNYAMVTDNGGGGPWDNDVDNGRTILTSPTFDITGYANPVVNYSRWFYNGGTTNGAPDDSMKIFITNGITTVPLELLGPSNSASSWQVRSYALSTLITPTANMQLIVTVRDSAPVANIVEGGFDKFEVTGLTGQNEISISEQSWINTRQNPFDVETMVEVLKSGVLEVHDINGRLIERIVIRQDMQQITIGRPYEDGLYLLRLITKEGSGQPVKLIKQ